MRFRFLPPPLRPRVPFMMEATENSLAWRGVPLCYNGLIGTMIASCDARSHTRGVMVGLLENSRRTRQPSASRASFGTGTSMKSVVEFITLTSLAG
jgi:hypothetical protein